MKFLPESPALGCAALCFSFLISQTCICLAEVAKLQKKLLLSFTEASIILTIRKAHQIQITTESPNMYAVILQINVYRGNVLSECAHPTHEVFLIAEEVPELMERKANDCS